MQMQVVSTLRRASEPTNLAGTGGGLSGQKQSELERILGVPNMNGPVLLPTSRDG